MEKRESSNQTFKVGDKVRILDASKIAGGRLHYYNGMKTEVLRIDDDGDIYLRDKNGAEGIYVSVISELHAIEKISEEAKPKSTKNQRITTLEQTVDQLNARIEKLEAIVKAKNTRPAREFLAELRKSTTPNQRRKAIIDEAKAFVEETEKKMSALKKNHEGNYTFRETCSTAKFNVNSEKRAVTALVYHKDSGSLLEKAIAKCAPDDVFNADISKAIALGRALGLDVSKFEQAVKPTEVVVGQLLTFNKSDEWHLKLVYRVDSMENSVENLTIVTDDIDNTHVGRKALGYFENGKSRSLTIIDDTEAQYV